MWWVRRKDGERREVEEGRREGEEKGMGAEWKKMGEGGLVWVELNGVGEGRLGTGIGG